VAVVGEDFPEETIELFKSRGIDVRGLEIQSGKTFHWEARYGNDPNQRTTIKTELNVFEDFSPQLPPDYTEAEIVFLANIDPDLQEDILSQVKHPKLVAMDTMNLWIKTKPDPLLRVLEKVNVYFANDEEIKMLAKEPNLIKAGKKLLERGPSFIVIKKGVLAYPCEKVIDPTGAGDSFAGGFLGYLDKIKAFDEEGEIRKASVYGSVLASFTIEDFGINRFKSLSLEDIEKRFSQFKKLVSF
jgi:sugar/nucleoside kinase (ribokinase family)